jgi:RHS repeat-associated protein
MKQAEQQRKRGSEHDFPRRPPACWGRRGKSRERASDVRPRNTSDAPGAARALQRTSRQSTSDPHSSARHGHTRYDGDGIGNDTLTKSRLFTSAGTSLDTSYLHDYRDRQTNSRTPDNVAVQQGIDNLGRARWVESFASADFVYTAAKRRGRSETLFDQKGQVWRTLVYNVSPSTDGVPGQLNNYLRTDFWSNGRGQVVKTRGPNGECGKAQYDGVGRVKASFTTYDDSETTYAQALDVAGDTVIEQSVPAYDANSNVIQTDLYQRTNVTAKMGDLSTSWAESDSRRSYTATWFDAVNRATGFVDYGRNGGVTLIRPSAPPVPADAYLVTTTQYDTAGRPYRTVDNKSRITERTFDALERVTKTVENRVDGIATETEFDTDRTTEQVYDGAGRLSQRKAHNPKGLGQGVEVQVTRYVYGSDANLPSPAVWRNDMLVAEMYPDSDDTYNPAGVAGAKLANGADGTYDRIEFTYDYASRKSTWKLQDTTQHAYTYDSMGRFSTDQATALGAGIDGAVRRIEHGYETNDLSRLLTISSYSAVTAGTLLNQIRYGYDGWGQEKKCEQGHEGSATGAPSFQRSFAEGAVGSAAKYVRLAQSTYPNGRVVATNYPASGVGDKLSRPDNLANDSSGTVKFVQMTYLGAGGVVKIAHPQVTGGLNLDYGTATGNPGGWDDLGRIKDQKWQSDGTVIKDRYQYGYDRTSNRLFRDNLTATGKDHFYVHNGLDQLTSSKQGDLNAGRTEIAGTPAFQESWLLESHGNWKQLVQATFGVTTLNQSRAHSKANEVTAIAATVGSNWGDGVSDRNGFMTRVPRPGKERKRWRLTSDAWQRVVRVAKDGSGKRIAEYKYDGLHRRTVKLKANGPRWDRRDYYYSDDWQVVEERELLKTASKSRVATLPKFQWVWGLRHIDEVVFRDENKDGDGDCADGADQRLYAAQDANWNVTAIINTSGTVVERVLYDAYGKSTLYNAAWSATQASTLYNNEVLFAGYRFDPESGLYQVRNRHYHPTLGRWVQRDPIGYADGMGLYEYVGGNPANSIDPYGLQEGSTVAETNNRPAATAPSAALEQERRVIRENHGDNRPAADLIGDSYNKNFKDYSGGEGRWTVVEAPAVIPQPESFLEELGDSYRNKTVRRMSDGSTVTTIDSLPLAILKEAVLTVAGAKVLGTLVRLGTRAAPLAGKIVNSRAAITRALSRLRGGQSPGVRVVGSEAELKRLFGRLSAGGKSATPAGYRGRMVELPDGTRVGLRDFSTSGGPAIDIHPPSSSPLKVHIDPWP